MHCIVTDEDFVNEDGTPRQDAAIHGFQYGQYILCHPSLVDKVKDGFKQMIGKELGVFTKDEWKEKNLSFVSES